MSNSFIIVLTRKCYPCGCSYCNVLKNDFNDFWSKLSEDKSYLDYNISNIVDFILKNKLENIRFFGGEVFLKKELLIYLISKIRSLGFKGDIFVNTNLHLFENEDIFWIKKYNIKIISSLNGFEKLHCKTRGVKQDDYKKLLETINLLLKNNIDLQINNVLFPYEEDFIEKIKFILSLGNIKLNLLPLMYSNLVNKNTIPGFIEKIEKLFMWIKENNLQKKFLNFEILEKENNFPLVVDDVVLDSDANIYLSMIVLEKFILNMKDLLFLSNLENIKSLDLEKDYNKIILGKVYEKLFSDLKIFKDSVDLSNRFSSLIVNYK